MGLCQLVKEDIGGNMEKKLCKSESGRVGYLVLWMMGAPITVLLILWVLLGNNIFSAG